MNTNFINFTKADDFIKWVEKQKRFSPKANLDKMNYYCMLFDHPEKSFKSIHVTGTNGKGSTVACLYQILTEANLNIATYTSPYVTIFNERIQYKGNYISDEDLLKYGNIILSKYDQMTLDGYEHPSFFEFITLLAFLYFQSLTDLDFAIIEVGMGGRLDATNVIDSEVAIITNVAFDHMQVLGDTLEKIAYEKMGIVKNHEPLITGIKDSNIQKYIKELCYNRQSALYLTALEAFEIKKMDIYGSQIILNDPIGLININLAGFHQIENAMIAIKTIQVLNEKYGNTKRNFPISNAILKRGLNNVIWAGRFEILNKKPLIITDGAHNIDGIMRICEFIKGLNYPFKRAVISISKDKELTTMIPIIANTFDEIIFTKYEYNRSADPFVLYNMMNESHKMIIENIDQTLSYVMNNPVPFTIFMGSLYLVTDIKKRFNQ